MPWFQNFTGGNYRAELLHRHNSDRKKIRTIPVAIESSYDSLAQHANTDKASSVRNLANLKTSKYVSKSDEQAAAPI